MEEKVILMSIDGMRHDGLQQCGSDAAASILDVAPTNCGCHEDAA